MADNWQDSQDLQCTETPEKACMRVPCGHLVVSTKWRNSELSNAIQGVRLVYEDKLGFIDFHPSTQIGVVYATEADLVSQASLRRKLAKLRKANQVQVLVLAEKTGTSGQYFLPLQKYVALELGFTITPIPGQIEAAGILTQMVLTESKLESNPFRKRRRPPNLDEMLLSTVQSIPKLGAIKARKLLERFKSLKAIQAATVEELTLVVGKASAENVRTFLNS